MGTAIQADDGGLILPGSEGEIRLDEKTIESIASTILDERSKRGEFSISEVGVRLGVNPQNSAFLDLFYRAAKSVNWHEPTDEGRFLARIREIPSGRTFGEPKKTSRKGKKANDA
jgi:hypothetical protein